MKTKKTWAEIGFDLAVLFITALALSAVLKIGWNGFSTVDARLPKISYGQALCFWMVVNSLKSVNQSNK